MSISKDPVSQGLGMRVEWDKASMATGFEEIDAQHREWLARFNALVDAINHRRGAELWGEALLFFMRYTEKHFGFEERLMKTHSCTTQELNRSEHEKFRQHIAEVSYMTWPLGPTDADVLTLEKELGDWLRHHICTIDFQMRDCLK